MTKEQIIKHWDISYTCGCGLHVHPEHPLTNNKAIHIKDCLFDVNNICEHLNIFTEKNVGYDIDPSGEEKQHVDTCEDCGMWRFNIDRIDFEEDKFINYKGEWNKKEDRVGF